MVRFRNILLVSAFGLWCCAAKAQIPYFAGTVGNGKLYGYTSLKVRPGVNAQETYTCFQYGVGDHLAMGSDLYTGVGSEYLGFLIRYGLKISPYFNIGGQVTPSFNLNSNMDFSYANAALYTNGNISDDGNLFWCMNTWWCINDGTENTIYNWEFIGYTVNCGKHSLTPMVGAIHSLKFNQDPDLSMGVYYTVGKYNWYIWGNDFFNDNPRLVLGVDFAL